MKFFSFIILSNFLSLLSAAGSFAAQPLLTYECTFQAGHTNITILDDGTVTHYEMPGHPPRQEMHETNLSESELSELRQLIEESKIPDEEYVRREKVELGLGQRVGTFEGYLDGSPVLLMQIIRKTTGTGTSVINPSPSVTKLQQWVVSRTHAQNIFSGNYGATLTDAYTLLRGGTRSSEEPVFQQTAFNCDDSGFPRPKPATFKIMIGYDDASGKGVEAKIFRREQASGQMILDETIPLSLEIIPAANSLSKSVQYHGLRFEFESSLYAHPLGVQTASVTGNFSSGQSISQDLSCRVDRSAIPGLDQ